MASESEAEKKKIEEKWNKGRQRNMPVFFLQVAFAVAFNVCVLGGGYYLLPAVLPLPSSNDLTVKLLYTLRCFIFPQTISLIFAIIRVREREGIHPPEILYSARTKTIFWLRRMP